MACLTQGRSVLYLDGLEEIIDQYDAYIIDLWGVIHDGFEIYPSVLSCLEYLKNHQKSVFFLSNSPRRMQNVQEQLDHLGIPRRLYQGLHTSGEDAYETLSAKQDAFYHSLGSHVYPLSLQSHGQLFKDLHLILVNHVKEASFILNTGPETTHVHQFDEILQEAASLDLPMICVNPDISVIGGGKVTLCAGAIAERYKELGGQVRYHGKPYPQIYDSLLRKMGYGKEAGAQKTDVRRILAIGDSLVTDIKGA